MIKSIKIKKNIYKNDNIKKPISKVNYYLYNGRQRRLKHIYLKTDGDIDYDSKLGLNSKNSIRKTVNIRSRNDNFISPNKLNNSNSISSSLRYNKKLKELNKSVRLKNGSYIIDLKRGNKTIKEPKFNIEIYSKKNNSKEKNKKIQNKNNINNNNTLNTSNTYNIINSYNANNKEIPNKRFNKKNNKLRKKKLINNATNENNNIKYDKYKIKKSNELRTKFGYSFPNKNDFSLDKIDIFKIRENKKQIEKEKERIYKSERIKKKEKIKIDKGVKYNGVLDSKNFIISDSIEYIQEKINNSLKLNKIKYWKLNPLKYSCCTNYMDKFFIEILFISELEEYNNNSIKKTKNNDFYDTNNNFKPEKKYIFYIKILLSKENNDIPNTKLLEKVIDNILVEK